MINLFIGGGRTSDAPEKIEVKAEAKCKLKQQLHLGQAVRDAIIALMEHENGEA